MGNNFFPNSILCIFLLFAGKISAQSPPRDLFVFDADERLFTAHAFMNAGGYDLEYNDDGMHPVRAEIREYLNNKLPENYRDSIRDYYKSHEHYLGYYGTYAFATTGAPHFRLEFDSSNSSTWVKSEIEVLSNLDAQLSEFYKTAEIRKLWELYLPQIQKLHDKFRPHAAGAIQHLKIFFRSKEVPFKSRDRKIITAFSPLLSYFQAFTVTVNGSVYLVFGPQPGEPGPSSYYHEAGHYFVDPVVEKYRNKTQHLEPLFRLAREKQGSFGYAFVEESLVRTVDIFLSGKLFNSTLGDLQARINTEYEHGFVLCPYFFEALPLYEKSEQTFNEYYPVLIEGIDLDKEINRWKEYWRKSGEME